MSKQTTSWVAVDWGSSNLRVWVMEGTGEVLATLGSDQGMSRLQPEDFEAALLDLIAPYLDQTPGPGPVPVIACGMVGARQGWAEAPYVATPCAPPGLAQALRPGTRDPRLDLRILPGVKQVSPPDVMRGEETQIAGFLRAFPEFDGVLCLPGTHTKWVHISAREIVSFRTFMTGEIFALLAENSVLRHTVGGEGWDDAAFGEAVSDALSAPQRLGARLFGLRAGALLQDTAAATSRARLSGLLLGLELAGARDYWLGQDIALIGAPKLTALYAKALAAQGAMPREVDGANIVLVGLNAAHAELGA